MADTPNNDSRRSGDTGTDPSSRLIEISAGLRDSLAGLSFAPPVHTVYNPLDYAFEVYREYLLRYAATGVNALFMGMNPGPWGMAQTGIPFGAVNRVGDWMGLGPGSTAGGPGPGRPDSSGRGGGTDGAANTAHAGRHSVDTTRASAPRISRPVPEHPKRPIQGFDCPRVEVSGDRLWGLMSERYPAAADFFREHMVLNYCPLVFMEDSGRNRTPDKLPAGEKGPLFSLCDRALGDQIEVIAPKMLIGVGKFAEKRLQTIVKRRELDIPVRAILHPSPASPAANRDWAGTVTRQLIEAGVWR